MDATKFAGNTCGEVTSHKICLRYDRHFVVEGNVYMIINLLTKLI